MEGLAQASKGKKASTKKTKKATTKDQEEEEGEEEEEHHAKPAVRVPRALARLSNPPLISRLLPT